MENNDTTANELDPMYAIGLACDIKKAIDTFDEYYRSLEDSDKKKLAHIHNINDRLRACVNRLPENIAEKYEGEIIRNEVKHSHQSDSIDTASHISSLYNSMSRGYRRLTEYDFQRFDRTIYAEAINTRPEIVREISYVLNMPDLELCDFILYRLTILPREAGVQPEISWQRMSLCPVLHHINPTTVNRRILSKITSMIHGDNLTLNELKILRWFLGSNYVHSYFSNIRFLATNPIAVSSLNYEDDPRVEMQQISAGDHLDNWFNSVFDRNRSRDRGRYNP